MVWVDNSSVRYKVGSLRAVWDRSETGKQERGQGLDKASRGPRGRSEQSGLGWLPRELSSPGGFWREHDRALGQEDSLGCGLTLQWHWEKVTHGRNRQVCI